jgi:hypothetical protein
VSRARSQRSPWNREERLYFCKGIARHDGKFAFGNLRFAPLLGPALPGTTAPDEFSAAGEDSAVARHPPCSSPLVGKQLGQSAGRVSAEAFEDVAQIGKRIDVESLARRDEAG